MAKFLLHWPANLEGSSLHWCLASWTLIWKPSKSQLLGEFRYRSKICRHSGTQFLVLSRSESSTDKGYSEFWQKGTHHFTMCTSHTEDNPQRPNFRSSHHGPSALQIQCFKDLSHPILCRKNSRAHKEGLSWRKPLIRSVWALICTTKSHLSAK